MKVSSDDEDIDPPLIDSFSSAATASDETHEENTDHKRTSDEQESNFSCPTPERQFSPSINSPLVSPTLFHQFKQSQENSDLMSNLGTPHLPHPHHTPIPNPLPHHTHQHLQQQAVAAVAQQLHQNMSQANQANLHLQHNNLHQLLASGFLQQQSERIKQDILSKQLLESSSAGDRGKKAIKTEVEGKEIEEREVEEEEKRNRDVSAEEANPPDGEGGKDLSDKELVKKEVTADSKVTTPFSVLDILDPHKFTGRVGADMRDCSSENMEEDDDSTFISGETLQAYHEYSE